MQGIPFANEKSYSKEDLFMRGMSGNPTHKIDSMKIYSYDKDWKLIEEKVLLEHILYDVHSLAKEEKKFLKNEYNLRDRLIKVVGKVGQLKVISLKSSEFDLFTIENNNDNITIDHLNDSITSVAITPTFKLSILIEPGINNYDLYIEGESYIKKRMRIEVLGYGIASSDFYEMKTQARDNALKLSNTAEVYIEKEENEHLLRIRKEGEENLTIVTTSKIANRLDLPSLGTGEFLLELTNLKTDKKKYCKILLE